MDNYLYKTPKKRAAGYKLITHYGFFFRFSFLGNLPITLYYPNSIYN